MEAVVRRGIAGENGAPFVEEKDSGIRERIAARGHDLN